MRILRLQEVLRMTGLSRSTIDRLEASGRFPARRRPSPRTIGWLEDDVVGWLRGSSVAGAHRPSVQAP